jgi:hypothetical protein
MNQYQNFTTIILQKLLIRWGAEERQELLERVATIAETINQEDITSDNQTKLSDLKERFSTQYKNSPNNMVWELIAIVANNILSQLSPKLGNQIDPNKKWKINTSNQK